MTTVRITLKLFATLSGYLPESARGTNEIALETAKDATIEAIIARFNLPRQLCHLVVVNGEFVPQQEREQRTLQDGDVLAIWPPIAGG